MYFLIDIDSKQKTPVEVLIIVTVLIDLMLEC